TCSNDQCGFACRASFIRCNGACLAAPTLSSIAITPMGATVAHTMTQQFTAYGTYCDGTKQDLTKMVTWASSLRSVATISNTAGSQGLATANEGGATTISGTLGSISGTTTLNVNGAVLVSISLTPQDPTIQTGTSLQFTATGHYSDASTFDLT